MRTKKKKETFIKVKKLKCERQYKQVLRGQMSSIKVQKNGNYKIFFFFFLRPSKLDFPQCEINLPGNKRFTVNECLARDKNTFDSLQNQNISVRDGISDSRR